ncbi:unnamed protein product, partial [Hapterophycus canaliculatus]
GNSSGNRVTFKRTAPEDFEAYGEYEMDRSGGGGGRGGGVSSSSSSNGAGAGQMGAPGNNGARAELGKSNMKRARGGEGSGGGGGGVMGRHGRRMSEARMSAKVAASPSVVQALTCLASGLPESSSDSEDNPEEAAAVAAAAAAAAGNAARRRGSRDGVVKREQPDIDISSNSFGGEEDSKAAQDMSMPMPMPMPNVRRGSKAIRDVVSKLSIDQALEQLKSEEGGGEEGGEEEEEEEEEGEEQKEHGAHTQVEQQHKRDRQRASVYVLMHAIAAVDTANDETWRQEEPLDSLD